MASPRRRCGRGGDIQETPGPDRFVRRQGTFFTTTLPRKRINQIRRVPIAGRREPGRTRNAASHDRMIWQPRFGRGDNQPAGEWLSARWRGAAHTTSWVVWVPHDAGGRSGIAPKHIGASIGRGAVDVHLNQPACCCQQAMLKPVVLVCVINAAGIGGSGAGGVEREGGDSGHPRKRKASRRRLALWQCCARRRRSAGKG